ncbi:MAG: protease modulator HflK [Sphingopyxis sp.]
MTRKLTGPSGPEIVEMAAGPWGGEDAPEGENGEAPPPKGSPWLPGGEAGRGNGARSRGFDEILKRSPFGPGLPQFSGGGKIWRWTLLAIALLWIGLTSVHSLEPEEDGVITRFGSYSRTVGPGVSLTLPLPIERLIKVPSRRVVTENIPANAGQNLVLTGDASIINLAYSVRWTVKQPERYVFQVEGQSETIRAAAESAMRASVANFTLAQAIGSGRTDIELQVARRLQAILDYYRMGVRIDGVSIRDSGPPTEVEAAFNQVNAARQTAESAANQARGYAARVVRQAEGEAADFDTIYEQYRQSPEVTRRRLYYETMEAVLTPSDKTIVASGGTVPYLPLPQVQRRPAPPRAPSPAAPTTGEANP